jgi:hypothetical protein
MGSRGRPRIGDVIAIPTPAGEGYAQYTHDHEDYGELIRVLPGTLEQEPGDLQALVDQRERFNVFFPLAAALRQGIVNVVANAAVPRAAHDFPRFRAGIPVPGEPGKYQRWYIWDGAEEWPVDELSDEQRDLSIREIVNDTMLVKLIVSGWSPRDEV